MSKVIREFNEEIIKLAIKKVDKDKFAEFLAKKIESELNEGIVSDSIAEKELEETRAKAKGLLKIFKR